ncbi:hypothetical protein AALO_G00199970 [Alosa alosa]|uniref:T. brucei spp.-specific protein n=1 Tax=Alosa alosa TaxID=278164 RepID=A0AAV6G2A2_9TELE|nr:hypothetical protein AALO_G00199970 [Alosa alosa]
MVCTALFFFFFFFFFISLYFSIALLLSLYSLTFLFYFLFIFLSYFTSWDSVIHNGKEVSLFSCVSRFLIYLSLPPSLPSPSLVTFLSLTLSKELYWFSRAVCCVWGVRAVQRMTVCSRISSPPSHLLIHSPNYVYFSHVYIHICADVSILLFIYICIF